MYIPNRLKTIGDYINDNSSIADIGADHGLLEEYIVSKHENCKILAIENKLGPYNILKKKVSSLKGVETSLSDGLNKVKEGTDVVVLAGMGGLNIVKILKENEAKVPTFKRIIVDAHRDIDLVRKAVISYGYKITSEKLIYEDSKFYIISVFDKVSEIPTYKEEELTIGYRLENDELWPKYKKYLLSQAEKAMAKITNNQDRVLEFKKVIERIENYGKN